MNIYIGPKLLPIKIKEMHLKSKWTRNSPNDRETSPTPAPMPDSSRADKENTKTNLLSRPAETKHRNNEHTGHPAAAKIPSPS